MCKGVDVISEALAFQFDILPVGSVLQMLPDSGLTDMGDVQSPHVFPSESGLCGSKE